MPQIVLTEDQRAMVTILAAVAQDVKAGNVTAVSVTAVRVDGSVADGEHVARNADQDVHRLIGGLVAQVVSIVLKRLSVQQEAPVPTGAATSPKRSETEH